MSSSPLAIFLAPAFLKGVYAGNLAWHSSAFFHFCFRQPLIMRKLSLRKRSKEEHIAASPAGDGWHHDLLSYIGAINLCPVLLAGLRLYALFRPSPSPTSIFSSSLAPTLDLFALSCLAVANASQAVCNFFVARPSGRWIVGRGFDRITVLDPTFTILDTLIVIARLLE